MFLIYHVGLAKQLNSLLGLILLSTEVKRTKFGIKYYFTSNNSTDAAFQNSILLSAPPASPKVFLQSYSLSEKEIDMLCQVL